MQNRKSHVLSISFLIKSSWYWGDTVRERRAKWAETLEGGVQHLAERWRWPCCFLYSRRALDLVWQTAPVGCVVGTGKKQLWEAGGNWSGLWDYNRYPKGSSRKRPSYSRLSSGRAQPGRVWEEGRVGYTGRGQTWRTPLCPTAHIHKPQLSLTMWRIQINSGFISEGLQ